MTREERYNEMSNKVFLRNVAVQYWYFVLIFGLIIIGGIIGFILILNEYIDTSAIGGQGTWTFEKFSMGTGVEWIIFLFFWPLLIIGVPALVVTGFIAAIIWYEVFNSGLKEEIKFRSKREEEKRRRFGKTSESSGLFGFFMFVGVCVYIALDGNWMTEFGNLNLRYFVDAWIAVFLWFIIICGIGVAIGTMWFVNKYES